VYSNLTTSLTVHATVGEAIVEATKNGAFSLVGGGDSVACVNKFGFGQGVSYVQQVVAHYLKQSKENSSGYRRYSRIIQHKIYNIT